MKCRNLSSTFAENYPQLRKPPEKISLDCHGAESPNGAHAATLEEHTHHKAGSVGSQCVACHMPNIETEGVPDSFVSANTFRFITPPETDKYKVPSPCNPAMGKRPPNGRRTNCSNGKLSHHGECRSEL